MFLTLLVLSALSKTISDTGKIRANRAEMDRAIEELHALNLIRSDIVAALLLVRPEEGESGAVLRLRRVDPDISFADRIGPLANAEDPWERSERVEVAYQIREEALVRAVGPVDGRLVDERVQRCHAMDVLRQQNAIKVELTFEYSRVEKTRTMRVELR